MYFEEYIDYSTFNICYANLDCFSENLWYFKYDLMDLMAINVVMSLFIYLNFAGIIILE